MKKLVVSDRVASSKKEFNEKGSKTAVKIGTGQERDFTLHWGTEYTFSLSADGTGKKQI